MLVEKIMKKEAIEIAKIEKKSMFFLPSDESPNGALTKPATKHPIKKED